MIKARTYTAYLMLLAFVAVLTPWPVLHDVVANHTAEDDTHCLVFHKNSGVHIEESHNDCPVFEAQALLYTPIKGQASVQNHLVLTAEYVSCISLSIQQNEPRYSSPRAPPCNV